MKTKLSKNGVPYTPLELKAFEILTKRIGGMRSTLYLAEKIYGRKPPINSRQATMSVLNTLARKIIANKEPFRLKRTKRIGPHAVFHWIEKEIGQ